MKQCNNCTRMVRRIPADDEDGSLFETDCTWFDDMYEGTMDAKTVEMLEVISYLMEYAAQNGACPRFFDKYRGWK